MKTIVVSGSSSGIGRAITENLLQDNHQVVGLARNHTKFSPDTEFYQPLNIDFSDINTLEQNLKDTLPAFHQIDGIICSAGYGKFAELEQLSVFDMQQLMHVNFLSQVILIKLLLPRLKQQQAGHIIVIGSESALSGAKKGSLYCASKFALRGFCQSLRHECVSSNIAVSLINPGFVNTPFFDDLDFSPADGKVFAIEVQRIAEIAANILTIPSECVIEEINLQPLKRVVKKK